MPHPTRQLGIVTEGSLSRGLTMRLAGTGVEEVRVGQFVVVEGARQRFFSLLTDVALGHSDPGILLDPPAAGSLLASALEGAGTFGTAEIAPMLGLEPGGALKPVKTIPPHFAPVREAGASDFATVFGDEQAPGHFAIGTPPDVDAPVCLDLGRFVERSNAVFGKSGTGKSFLTRLILAGTIQRETAVNLVFDMHNEYGWQSRSENADAPLVKGLAQLFGTRVAVFTLDPESSKRRGVPDAQPLTLGLEQIEIDDLALLREELNLSEASLENAWLLREGLGEAWLSRFLAMTNTEIEGFVETQRGHAGAIKALQRKLARLAALPYVRPGGPDAIGALLKYLEAGRHVVLEFGAANGLLSYMLAANVITRRLHGRYTKAAEAHNADPIGTPAPRPLMITIEEAHRFLSSAIARQTIFGTIAREMRKYFVTLLIVDQRPSGIDAEILSQVGTRVTALLNDEKDIDAVFTGVPGGARLRTVLAQLDPKQQALLLGYAVPMPVVVRTRAYDAAFYAALGADASAERGRRHMTTLWPE